MWAKCRVHPSLLQGPEAAVHGMLSVLVQAGSPREGMLLGDKECWNLPKMSEANSEL